jgi:hypothetical protein
VDSKISVPYFSYGTLYGTVYKYNPDGSLIGTMDLTGLGIYFSLYADGESGSNRKNLLDKSIGTGCFLQDATKGLYGITFRSLDLDIIPGQYYYSIYVGNSPTYVEGTTDIKSVGSGIFEITPGVRYP